MSAPTPDPAAVRAAITALRRGRMVLLVSQIDGGYRGDLVLAAERATAQSVNLLTGIGRGPVQVAMRSAELDRLEIPPADPSAADRVRDRFRVPVGPVGSAAAGVYASQRAKTIRALADPSSTAREFSRLGHVFPLGCAGRGVLDAPVPPEAAMDLAEQAGMSAAGVLCEVCGADGEAARLSELLELGAVHGLPVVSIEDLIAYRRRELCRVERRGVARIPLPVGEFRAVGFIDGLGRDHIAFVHGQPRADRVPLVRVHVECLFGDTLGSLFCDCGTRFERALEVIARAGHGVLVYVRSRDAVLRGLPGPLSSKRSCAARHSVDPADLMSAFEILDELGMHEIRLLTAADEDRFIPEQVRILDRIELTGDPRDEVLGAMPPRPGPAGISDSMGRVS
ncbi:3,4-dihydroxy-2-butanone-4-phosphate synthase [Nocardia vaccinii]|uniref:3,4-dihydroxy-2-butanone-4-phosphate synthase n=1 Tax=Nocardia vaccinii TaxID=1822 RepID=UPI000829CD5A|nr:3,4-dihydroxy-2-butanone-4-phosphate synthase [Nocardia vaccinii]